MLFNSYIFVFLFLPAALAGYYIWNRFGYYRAANVFLTGMSLWFYGYFNYSYLPVICLSIVLNYLVSKGMDRNRKNPGYKKLLLALGIFADIAVIFYFKYFDFFIGNVNVLFGSSFALKNIVLPLGISFFTFQQVSYLVDSYRGEVRDYSFDEYALFVSFFPQLIAGPIVLHSEVLPQFRDRGNRRVIQKNFSEGLYIFAIGLFKKVIIADTFGKVVTFGFGAVPVLSSMEALIVSLSYTFQLYFDFSGYCDMAVGIGCLFNIRLPQNFSSPYKSKSITEFWSRWHMSLTRFLRTYIYIPLGGNRKGRARTYLNIMVVYLVSGIWHGANWTFILWGVLHGALNCLSRLFREKTEKLWGVVRWLGTFTAVNLLWILFRADSIGQAAQFMKRLFGFDGFSIRGELYECFDLTELTFLESRIPFLGSLFKEAAGFHLWLFIAGAFIIVLLCKNTRELEFKPTIGRSLVTVMFMVWSIMSFAGVSTFLYFDF